MLNSAAMKKLNRSFIVLAGILGLIILSACEKKDTPGSNLMGTIQFSFSLSSGEKEARTGSDSSIASYQLMISVEDLKGNAVLTDKLIPLYIFGTGFISDKIELKAGQYNLTRLLVLDPSGTVIYASPLEGSSLAYLLKDPLPVQIKITADQVTSIAPEVLAVGNYSPVEFGYISFGVQIIKPLDLYAVCYLYNPLIMAPTSMTDAVLTVYSADDWTYTFNLKAAVNHLIIRGGSDSYTFVVSREGYSPVTYKYSSQEIENTTPESPLGLKIPWGTQSGILELQPGPADGKDATISNLQPDKNFGDYTYFEATFLSEPILTVMRSNRSLIAFSTDSLPKSASITRATLVLYYDVPLPVDSAFYAIDPSTGTGKYAAVFQQIIEPWDEHKVTWNNQPKTTEINQVYLYPFVRNANFIGVDVTQLFSNPSASVLPFYGLMFRLWPDDNFPGFRFVSGDYPVASMRPKLILQYTI